MRLISIWKNGIITGFVDLALERAFVYKEHAPSEVINLADGDAALDKDARFSCWRRLRTTTMS